MPIFAAGGGCIDPYSREHMRVTQDTLNDLGAGDIPMLIVYNKADRLPQFASRSSDRYRKPYPYGSRCRPWHGCPCRLDLIQPLWQACDHGTFDPLQPGFALHRISKPAKSPRRNTKMTALICRSPSHHPPKIMPLCRRSRPTASDKQHFLSYQTKTRQPVSAITLSRMSGLLFSSYAGMSTLSDSICILCHTKNT